jgi:hypothetical protein
VTGSHDSGTQHPFWQTILALLIARHSSLVLHWIEPAQPPLQVSEQFPVDGSQQIVQVFPLESM